MKAVVIGDAHCKISNIEECQKLMDFAIKTAEEKNIKKIILSGDINDNHSVIRGQVQNFWDSTFEKISSKNIDTMVLYGNHDYNNQKNPSMGGSLDIFKNKHKGLTIVDKIMVIENIVLAPYYHDREQFVIDVNSVGNDKRTVVCHQNFTQSLFGDMIDPAELTTANIVCGHVHSSHLSSGKVFYLGSPKWDTATDAGEEKGIWILEFSDEGEIISKEFLSTRSIVTPIDKMYLVEGDVEPTLDPSARNYLEIKGQSAWVNKMKKKYKGQANIKAVYMDRLVKSKKESSFNFENFMIGFKPIEGIANLEIEEYLKRLET